MIGTAAAMVAATSVTNALAQELAPSARQSWQIGGAFTQSEPGPLEQRANPVTPENPVPRRTFFVKPQYPAEAAAVGARATVSLRITVDELGRVGEARPLGIPVLGAAPPGNPTEERALSAALEALVRSAIAGVRQWLYDPTADGPISFDVVISFSPDAEPVVLLHGTLSRSQGSVVPLSPPLLAPDTRPGPVPPWAEGVPRVGGDMRQPTKVKHVNPIYPPAAKEARVTGVVILEARIEADGRIVNARVLRSIPLLDEAALDAVRQWEFTPTLLNGTPVPVLMTVTIQFSLN